jgi:CDGSH-type Zn-finger protein
VPACTWAGAQRSQGETVNNATITPTDNGPYLIAGSITPVDAEGGEHEVVDTIALCRCGHSSRKPFCDGTHEKIQFSAVNRLDART